MPKKAEKSGSVRDHYLTENKASMLSVGMLRGHSPTIPLIPEGWRMSWLVKADFLGASESQRRVSNGRQDLEILVKI